MAVTNQVNIYDYITPQALDAIYYLEGHFNGATKPKNYKGHQDPLTTYYGITENGLKTLRASKLQLPEFMKKATVSSLTKEQAREVTGLLAAAHTIAMDNAYNDENKSFSKLPLAWRSAVLTLAHSNGVNGWIRSYKEGNPGSVMKAFTTGNREVISRYLMAKKDGSIVDEPYGSDKAGRINRILGAVKLMYDTDNNSFRNTKAKDETFKRWKSNPHTVKNVQNVIGNIYLADSELHDFDDDLRKEVDQQMAIPAMTTQKKIDNQTLQQNETPAAKEESMLSKLTKPIKNLFTNNEEKQNVAKGNPDVAVQQSPGPLG